MRLLRVTAYLCSTLFMWRNAFWHFKFDCNVLAIHAAECWFFVAEFQRKILKYWVTYLKQSRKMEKATKCSVRLFERRLLSKLAKWRVEVTGMCEQKLGFKTHLHIAGEMLACEVQQMYNATVKRNKPGQIELKPNWVRPS